MTKKKKKQQKKKQQWRLNWARSPSKECWKPRPQTDGRRALAPRPSPKRIEKNSSLSQKMTAVGTLHGELVEEEWSDDAPPNPALLLGDEAPPDAPPDDDDPPPASYAHAAQMDQLLEGAPPPAPAEPDDEGEVIFLLFFFCLFSRVAYRCLLKPRRLRRMSWTEVPKEREKSFFLLTFFFFFFLQTKAMRVRSRARRG